MWQIWLNRPSVVAMRPYVKLLWALVLFSCGLSCHTTLLCQGFKRISFGRRCAVSYYRPSVTSRSHRVVHYLWPGPTLREHLRTTCRKYRHTIPWDRTMCVTRSLHSLLLKVHTVMKTISHNISLRLFSRLLWSPYGIGQTIIFLPCGFFFFFFFLLSFFPRLISAVADWMSAILPHMVWP